MNKKLVREIEVLTIVASHFADALAMGGIVPTSTLSDEITQFAAELPLLSNGCNNLKQLIYKGLDADEGNLSGASIKFVKDLANKKGEVSLKVSDKAPSEVSDKAPSEVSDKAPSESEKTTLAAGVAEVKEKGDVDYKNWNIYGRMDYLFGKTVVGFYNAEEDGFLVAREEGGFWYIPKSDLKSMTLV